MSHLCLEFNCWFVFEFSGGSFPLRKQLGRRISAGREGELQPRSANKGDIHAERQAKSEWVHEERGEKGLCRGTAPPTGAGHG